MVSIYAYTKTARQASAYISDLRVYNSLACPVPSRGDWGAVSLAGTPPDAAIREVAGGVSPCRGQGGGIGSLPADPVELTGGGGTESAVALRRPVALDARGLSSPRCRRAEGTVGWLSICPPVLLARWSSW